MKFTSSFEMGAVAQMVPANGFLSSPPVQTKAEITCTHIHTHSHRHKAVRQLRTAQGETLRWPLINESGYSVTLFSELNLWLMYRHLLPSMATALYRQIFILSQAKLFVMKLQRNSSACPKRLRRINHWDTTKIPPSAITVNKIRGDSEVHKVVRRLAPLDPQTQPQTLSGLHPMCVCQTVAQHGCHGVAEVDVP